LHPPDGGINPLELKADGPGDTSSFEEIPEQRGREAISERMRSRNNIQQNFMRTVW
jgi:hypothetical protein